MKEYKEFIDLGDKCRNQLNYYLSHYKDLPFEKKWERLWAVATGNVPDYSKFETKQDFENKFKVNQQEISVSLDTLMSTLRTYLSSLDVV
ncbi:MAG: hypothetical protein NC238_14260 [Dehalobacter sp.]|nr:hypothetical protein [Dehalobacter sp.]